MKPIAYILPHGYQGVVPCLPLGGCIAEGCLRCCMIQFIVVDEISLGPAHEMLGLGFIIGYCSQPEVLRDWFSPVYLRVGRSDDSRYLTLGP
jgi:hypothetical protein